jgi:fructose-specific phosphotransferase system IIC component
MTKIVMGAILGAIIPIVGMTPLSSMVLTALIGLTGVPMAVGGIGLELMISTCVNGSIATANGVEAVPSFNFLNSAALTMDFQEWLVVL